MIKRVVVWFSAGVSSAVAAKLTIDKYRNKYPIYLVNTDTGAEDDDNFRFMRDCEKWLGKKITILKNPKFTDTFDVYRKTKYIGGNKGARCTVELKKKVRLQFEEIETDLQIFGYDYDERHRAERFVDNNPLINVEFPLIDHKLTKMNARQILLENGIEEPLTYKLGFNNANCLKRGCVKGGMGYWNHIRKVRPKVFEDMAKLERELGHSIITKTVNEKTIKVFLDELDPTAGRHKIERIQCSLFCGEF